MKDGRLLWKTTHPTRPPLLVTDSLVVLACRPSSAAREQAQPVLRALDGEGLVRWELVRANVDTVHLVPHLVAGLVVAAVVSRDGSARVVELDLEGRVVIERQAPGVWPTLGSVLSFSTTSLIASHSDELVCLSGSRTVCFRVGSPEFVWESAAAVSGFTRDCAFATLPVAVRKQGNPGFAALDKKDGRVVWEADRMYNGIGTIPLGELFVEGAGSIWNRGPQSLVGLLSVPDGRVLWRTFLDGKQPSTVITEDALFVVSRCTDGTWSLAAIDWNGTARARVFTSPGPAEARIALVAVGSAMAVWRSLGSTEEVWCTTVEDPGTNLWSLPEEASGGGSRASPLDAAAFSPAGRLVLLREGELVSCFGS